MPPTLQDCALGTRLAASSGVAKRAFSFSPQWSEDGAMVALAPPYPSGFDTYHPYSKDPTPLVIVRRGDPEPQVLSVPGNIEPEAFSLDGGSLFVIDFVPPLAPERYRVARLDLSAGTVGDVHSKEQELQEPMRGTARAQVMAPDGRRLYTLYTRDATATTPGGGTPLGVAIFGAIFANGVVKLSGLARA